MMPRTTLALLSVLGAAVLMTACDSATAPVSNLRPAGWASADKGSGDDKDLCKKGGFANYTRADGSTFKNQGDCVSYVAQGGELLPKTPPPTITEFFVQGFGVDAMFTGGTGTVTDPTGTVYTLPNSNGFRVVFVVPQPLAGIWTLTVTNSGGSVTASFDCDYMCAFGWFDRAPGGKRRIGGG